jgi:hypothetical protein
VNGQAKLFETFSCSQQRDHHASLAANRSYVHDLNIAHHTSKSPFPCCSNDVFAALDNRCQASRRALASSPRSFISPRGRRWTATLQDIAGLRHSGWHDADDRTDLVAQRPRLQLACGPRISFRAASMCLQVYAPVAVRRVSLLTRRHAHSRVSRCTGENSTAMASAKRAPAP